MTKISRALAILLLPALFAAAQKPPDQPSAALLANVFNRNGGAIRDLTKDNFRVKVNGHSATLLAASYSLAPRRIVVLLDMSGSMSGELGNKKWQIAREAVENLLADTPDDVSIALVTFSGQVHDIFDFSQSRSSMAKWLEEETGKLGAPRVRGTTAILDAILAATKLFVPPRAGDSIYLVSDGDDNSSHIRARKVRALLLESRIRLFMFLFAEGTFFSDPQPSAGAIKEIAVATGGFIFGVRGRPSAVNFLPTWSFAYDDDQHTREKINLYTQSLNIQVNGFYTLHFDSPVPPAKARKISMEIVESTGKPRNNVVYTYSTALFTQPK